MKPAIIDIQGVGPAAARALAEHGIDSLKALAGASTEQIADVPGFSTTRATRVITAATDLLAASGMTSLPPADDPKKREKKAAKKDGKKGRKEKKDKKKKKKHKGKEKKKGK